MRSAEQARAVLCVSSVAPETAEPRALEAGSACKYREEEQRWKSLKRGPKGVPELGVAARACKHEKLGWLRDQRARSWAPMGVPPRVSLRHSSKCNNTMHALIRGPEWWHGCQPVPWRSLQDGLLVDMSQCDQASPQLQHKTASEAVFQ